MSSLSNDTNEFNEKTLLQLEDTRSSLLQNLPPQQNQEHSKEDHVDDIVLNSTKDDIEKTMGDIRKDIQLCTNSVNNCYERIFESIRDISFDYMNLQKDIFNSIELKWITFMKMNFYNYKIFQEKMIEHYPEICSTYANNMNLFKMNRTKNE